MVRLPKVKLLRSRFFIGKESKNSIDGGTKDEKESSIGCTGGADGTGDGADDSIRSKR